MKLATAQRARDAGSCLQRSRLPASDRGRRPRAYPAILDFSFAFPISFNAIPIRYFPLAFR